MANLDDVLSKVHGQGAALDLVVKEVTDFRATTVAGQATDQGKVDAIAAALADNDAKIAAALPPPPA